MRRNADRFCKLTFWPIVEIEGEIPSWHSCDSNFWCIGDNDDFRDGHELCDVPFSEVLPVHTVFEEPDFSSVWDAREKALLLESSLQLRIFDVEFDCRSKWWIKSNDTNNPSDECELTCGTLNSSSSSTALRLDGPPCDAPQFPSVASNLLAQPDLDPFGLAHADPRALPEWWQQLRALRDRHGLLEQEDEGSVIYVLTWYLHGMTFRQCDQPRVVRLDQDWMSWLDLLRDRWRERIDPNSPVQIGVVSPDPPSNVFQGHAAQLILAQNVVEESAGVVTGYFRSSRIDAIQQSAQILSPVLTRDEAIDAIPARVQCEFRQCFVYLGDLPLTIDMPLPTRMFTALTVEVLPLDDDVDDFSSFMQRSHCVPGASSSSHVNAVEFEHSPFLSQLQSQLSSHSLHVTGGQHFRIRTWFLHFSDVSYWTQARMIDLPLSSHAWISNLQSSWTDQLQDGHSVSFHLVHPAVPDLPRAPEQVILADVIVTQGSMPLRCGLVTVYPPDVATFYHVAISLSAQVSGIDILNGAHLHDLVSGRRCLINHVWHTIPVTSEPIHTMEHGHSFIVRFSGHHTDAPGEVIEGPPSPAVLATTIPDTMAVDEDGASSSSDSSTQEAMESEVWASDDEVMEGVHVYSLNRQTRHFFVRWTTYNAVLMDLARQLQIRLRDVIGIHYLAAPTVDQHDAEEGVILQYVNDIPIGSASKLALIDVEMHFHASTPTVNRQVHLLPPRICRDGLLDRLHFSDYCTRYADRCLLYWNNLAWPAMDLQEHDTQHGLYLRIVIYPLDDQIDDETFESEVATLLVASDTELQPSGTRSSDACSANAESTAASSSGLHRASQALRLLQLTAKRYRAQLAGTLCVSPCNAAPHVSPEVNSSSACTAFVFNVDAPAFQPGVLAIMQQSEMVQNLFETWNQAAIAWEDENRMAQINTWFVSHHLPFPRCQHPRRVALYDDVANWEETIKAAWSDQIIPGSALALFVVDPAPPHMEPGITAHVVVIQSPHEHWVSSLISVYDRDWHPDDGPYLRMVITTLNPLHFLQLVQQVGYEDICITSATPRLCTAWFGDVPIVTGHPVIGRNGCGLVLRIAHAAGLARERLTGGTVAHAHRPQPDPRTILLEHTVDAPVFISLDFRPVQDLHHKILNLDLGIVRFADQIVKWHPATQSALATTPIWQNELPLGFSFYTDGSSAFLDDERVASAAIVLTVHTPVGDRFGGFRSFQLAAGIFAPLAEMTGVLAAALWAQQLSEQFARQSPTIAFFFDCLVAGYTANGNWRIQSHVALQSATRSLVQWIERRYNVQCQWHHVFAHNGHPWNEAADAITWAVVSRWIAAPEADQWLPLLESSPAVHWLWLLEAATQGDPAFPPVWDGFMRVNASAPFTTPPDGAQHPMPLSRQPKDGSRVAISLTLRCATANVLTLHPTKAAVGTGISARMESLVRSFSQQQIDIIGVQETRSQLQGHTTCEGFHVLSSPASKKGVGGV